MQKSIDKNVLPKEYGGDVPIKDMIGQSLGRTLLDKKILTRISHKYFRAIQAENEGARKQNWSPGAYAHLHQTWIQIEGHCTERRVDRCRRQLQKVGSWLTTTTTKATADCVHLKKSDVMSGVYTSFKFSIQCSSLHFCGRVFCCISVLILYEF